MASGCPSENDIVARALGALPAERIPIIDGHVDECSECRILLAEATAGENETPPKAASRATFSTGEVIANRYVVVRWLAVGGMGEVYEVQDTCLDEQVALKTVIATIADDRMALARLKAEVRMARRVTHRNVCRVYDLGFHQRGTEQIAFLTMELLPGTTLRDRLSRAGALDADEAVPLVLQMVAALAHAHAAGIVHRDFKTDNVMLVAGNEGQAERLVVMDFGLARQSLVSVTQPLTPPSRTVLGTLDYMSPEQVIGKHATTVSDIYSLGVVMYELFTGRLPFEGESPLARASLRVTQKAPRLSAALPGVDPGIDRCVGRCLEAKPENRFATVEEVASAIRVERRPVSRSRLRIALLGLGLGLCAGLALLPVSTRTKASARPDPVRSRKVSGVAAALEGVPPTRLSPEFEAQPTSFIVGVPQNAHAPRAPKSPERSASEQRRTVIKPIAHRLPDAVVSTAATSVSSPVAPSAVPAGTALDPLTDPD